MVGVRSSNSHRIDMGTHPEDRKNDSGFLPETGLAFGRIQPKSPANSYFCSLLELDLAIFSRRLCTKFRAAILGSRKKTGQLAG
jgi:hypothetical protein